MSDYVTDEMVETARSAYERAYNSDFCFQKPPRDMIQSGRSGMRAALEAAAPLIAAMALRDAAQAIDLPSGEPAQ